MRSAVLFAFLIGAAATDWTKHRIYNLWILPGLFAGLLTAGWTGGGAGVRSAVGSMLLAFLLLFPVYLIGGIGAGDVKLFAAAALFLGARETLLSIFLSFFIGAGISVVRIAVERRFRQKIRFAAPILISILFVFGGKL